MPQKKHSVEVIKPEIPIDERLDLHEKGWVLQRIGWVFILSVMVLAALGLFGEGVLSTQRPKVAGVEAEYDRFFRYEKEMKILVRSPGEHISSITLPQTYLKNFRIVRIVPEPVENIATAHHVQYKFLGDANSLVSIYMVPEQFGSMSGTMRVNHAQFKLNHFIYP